MSGRLEGKTALVTGAGRGIGRALALGLAAEGATVHVNDLARSGDVVAELPEGRRGLALAYDVSDVAQVRALFARLDRLDVLVNCAGVTGWVDLDDPSEETWDRVIDTNLKGTFFCSTEAARLMRASGGGSIVNVSSVVGGRALRNLAAYGASKGGHQRADDPARRRARTARDPCQRVRPGRDERRSQPRGRSPLHRVVGAAHPARAGRRGGGHGRAGGVLRI